MAKKSITRYNTIWDAIDVVNAIQDLYLHPRTPEYSLVILAEAFTELDEKIPSVEIIPVLEDYFKPQKRNFSYLLDYPSSTWEETFGLMRHERLGTFSTNAWMKQDKRKGEEIFRLHQSE